MSQKSEKLRRSQRLKRELDVVHKESTKEPPVKHAYVSPIPVDKFRRRCICYDCLTICDQGVSVYPKFTPLEKKAHEVTEEMFADFAKKKEKMGRLLKWKSHDKKIFIKIRNKGKKNPEWNFSVNFFDDGVHFSRTPFVDEGLALEQTKTRMNHAIQAYICSKNDCQKCRDGTCEEDPTVTVTAESK